MRRLTQSYITTQAMRFLGVQSTHRPIVTVAHVPTQKEAWKGKAIPPKQILIWLNGEHYGVEKEKDGTRAVCLNHYEIRLYLTVHELRHLQPGGNDESTCVRAGKKAVRKHRRNPFRFIKAFFWEISG